MNAKYATIALTLLALLAPAGVSAQAKTDTKAGSKLDTKKPAVRGTGSAAEMVVTGDQEAPLVLYIVPWQETGAPKLVPAAPAVMLVPQVLDHERGLADEPFSKPLAPIGKP